MELILTTLPPQLRQQAATGLHTSREQTGDVLLISEPRACVRRCQVSSHISDEFIFGFLSLSLQIIRTCRFKGEALERSALDHVP
jgi:hypothetical protein